MCVATHRSVEFRSFVAFRSLPLSASGLSQATTVRVIPDENCGSSGLVPLRRTREKDGSTTPYFVFHSTKYVYKSEAALKAEASDLAALLSDSGAADSKSASATESELKSPTGAVATASAAAAIGGGAAFYPISYPTDLPMRHYLRAAGKTSDEHSAIDREKYGDNMYVVSFIIIIIMHPLIVMSAAVRIVSDCDRCVMCDVI